MHLPPLRWLLLLLLCAAAWGAAAAPAAAGERRFTYAYEPKVLPAGATEFETWWTSRIGQASGVYNRWDLRTEFEFGLTDTLQTAFYLNLRGVHQDGARWANDVPRLTGDTTEVKGFSNEWLWKVWDAAADPVGLGLYGEWTWDGEEFEWEMKLLLGKELGPVSLVWNSVGEFEWEFEHDTAERKLEIEREALVWENTLGLSLPLAGALRVGVELRQVSNWAEFTKPAWTVITAGPTLHYAADGWWMTCAVQAQLGAAQPTAHGREYADNTQVEVRLVLGIDIPARRAAAPAGGSGQP